MLKKERAQYIAKRLNELYPETPVPLDHNDPYTLLIAVLLSAQCTDERVNQVTPALFALANNPYDMARQSVDDVYQIIRPLRTGTAEICRNCRSFTNFNRSAQGRGHCRFRNTLRLSRASDIKPPALSCRRHLGSLRFRWILIFTVWHSAGG